MPAKLLLKFHAAVIKEIPIDKTPITIGRKPDNDIAIDNMAISGHHARISLQGSTYVIEDLQSTNGTFLNEKKVASSALKHNDQIVMGQHTLVFINPEATPQPEEPKPAPVKASDIDSTVVITPQKAAENAKIPEKKEVTGTLRVIDGKSDQPEYQLTGLLTYIGKGETATIKIKGLFAPEIAALISRRHAGYLITAVKDRYPKLNNMPLTGQVELKDSDLIEVGGIKFLFQLKETK